MPYRLLLADDSVTIQRVIELTFADEDIEVIAVGDGREAIRRIEADRPDIVLADVGMPEKDGYEVAAYVKNTPHLSHIPVLLLTGAFEPIDEQRAQAVGCAGVLAKPFEPQIVITRVNELLESAPSPPASISSPARVDPLLAPVPALSVEPVLDAPPVEAFEATAPAPNLAASGVRPNPFESLPQAPQEGRSPSDGTGQPNPAGVPASPPASPAAELDDYFEKLDAAFATLQQAPHRSGRQGLPPVPSGHSAGAFEEPQWLSTSVEQPLAAGTESRPVAHAPAIAQAFSALLAAEHGQAIPGHDATAKSVSPLSPEDVHMLVGRVTSEVLDRMSDRVVRDTVTDIVSRIAEKLVREEIDRVKATIK
ncbi:MAG: response regulator [Acidobacteria bacterium]|nr:response regulator [Acidobacteriota bacterium]